MAKGFALHLGLNRVDPNHYAGWSGPLGACEANALSMQEIADAVGYDSEILLTDKATRAGVAQGIEHAIANLTQGDIFLISYAGHGGQVPDYSKDEDDLADETWCLFDGEMIDDELIQCWSRFRPGVRIFVLSDSCHSGTVARALERSDAQLDETGRLVRTGSGGGEPVVLRAMPSEFARATVVQNRAFYRAISDGLPPALPEVTATVRLISACQDDQLAADGVFNGLFTGWLLRVWDGGGFNGDYEAFHSSLDNNMPQEQQPNHMVFGAPNPQFNAEKPFTI